MSTCSPHLLQLTSTHRSEPPLVEHSLKCSMKLTRATNLEHMKHRALSVYAS